MYEYKARVVKVVDGDTLHLDVDLGCDSHLMMTVRLAGIDAPEIRTNEGKVSKAWVENWLEARPNLILRTIKDTREKYGRYLGVVVDADRPTDYTLNEALVNEHLAVPYDGGKRG